MAIYKVRGSQNLFDIALHLYGSIEGLFDILITNPTISMTTELIPGMELEYHEDFVVNKSIVEEFSKNDQIIVNGERHVYYKPIDLPQRAIIVTPDDLDLIEFTVSGDGTMVVDWGDNSELEYIVLSATQTLISHYFDNTVDERRVKIYGNFNIQRLDLTRLDGQLYLTQPMTVDEFYNQANDNGLQSLFLFEGTYAVNLEKMVVFDLSPIYDMSLSELNLKGVRFSKPAVINDYLIYIRNNYGQRRACKVYLDDTPSSEAMQAIQEIISEKEWNTPDKWEFHIGDTVYTYIETETDGTDTN